MNDETFRSTEILFKPEELTSPKCNQLSIVQAIDESLKKINIDVRRSVFESLCLTGGTLDIRNIDKRIEAEVKSSFSGIHSVEVMQAQKTRQQAPWIGGCVASKLTTFQNYWIDKDSYEEYGSTALAVRKCF